MVKKYKIAVLMGGQSAEREISILTGREIAKALSAKGHQVKEVDLAESPVQKLVDYSPDVVFIALHGRLGEDGTVQGMMEVLGLPYTGSGVLASALGMNKIASKKMFKTEGVLTPDFIVVYQLDYEKNPDKVPANISEAIGLPCVVKPAQEGSTIGMSIVRKIEEIKPALKEAFRYDPEVLIEEFILGTEITVGILGNDEPLALPTLEIVSERDFYDYKAKYTSGLSRHIIPARLPEESRKRAQKVAVKAHKALECRGFSRVDIIVTDQGEPYVLEINTIPGMTALSLYPDAARAAGIEFPELVEKIIELALEKDINK